MADSYFVQMCSGYNYCGLVLWKLIKMFLTLWLLVPDRRILSEAEVECWKSAIRKIEALGANFLSCALNSSGSHSVISIDETSYNGKA
jgi:hypothetical protein